MKLFISGTWRSGTTLLSQILNSNSNVSVVYDAINFMRFVHKQYGLESIPIDKAIQCGKDVNNRIQKRFSHSINLESYNKQVNDAEKITYALIYDIIMNLYTGSANWGEKTVLQWRGAMDLLNMFDDLFFLHIIRDPRDVICSWEKYTIAPKYDYLDAIGNCYDSMKFAYQNKDMERYIPIKYEDILNDPKAEIKGICNTIGIPFESQMLNTKTFKNKVTGKALVNSSFTKSFNTISTDPIGRWKKLLPEEDIILIEIFLGELLDHFNYEPSQTDFNPISVINAIKKIQQSDLAWSGIMNILNNREGVQRNPLNEFDPSTWEIDKEKL